MTPGLNHEESWLLLPWLANGRLSQAERSRVEEHVRACASCAQELALQRQMCEALTEPERVTYAPGPSFRKLMQRIDAARPAPARIEERRPARARGLPSYALAAWRPPGVAFAASFVATIGLALAVVTAYQWSRPAYGTLSDVRSAPAGVLHIAFERSLPVGEVEEALRAAGARVVEGPGASGIFGVSPAGVTRPDAQEMRELARRLRSDTRVRWVEPLADVPAGASRPGSP